MKTEKALKAAPEAERQLPLLLKISEAARELGVGVNTVYEYIRDGEIETIDIARKGATQSKLRIPLAALVEYIAARPRVHTSTP